MVLTIIVVISAYAAPRFLSRSDQSAEFFLDELATAFDYSRIAALTSGCAVEFLIEAGSYTAMRPAVFCDTSAFAADVEWSDGRPVTGNADAGVALQGDVGSTVRIFADSTTDQAADLVLRSGARELVIYAGSGATELR